MDLENRKVDEWEIETQRIKCPRGQILQGQGPCWARNIGMSSLAIQVVKILHFSCNGHGFCPWPMNYYSTSLVAQPKIKKPLKTNRKKKKTETQVAKSRFAPGRETVTASRHIALHTISDCQSLNTMNSGSVGHCLGKRGLLESTAGDHTYLHSVATNPDDSGNGRQNSKLQINELWGFKLFFAL